MVGDVGFAFLNARMPKDNPDKILHMIVDPRTTRFVWTIPDEEREYTGPA
jgi:hypothetical protein